MVAAMHLKQVHYFLAVCETRSLTSAARICGISQPTMSMSIRRLEAELGIPLFERSAPVDLTTWSKAVRPLLKRIQETADRVHKYVAMSRHESASASPLAQ
jgi:DNA-binding transcriptional LysR family regulator